MIAPQTSREPAREPAKGPRGPTGPLAIPLAIRLLRDPRPVLLECAARYGPVWRTSMPGRGGLVSLFFLMGPAGNERVLGPAHREDFSWYEGYSFTMEPLFGRDILFLLDDTPEEPAHRTRKRLILPAFHPRHDEGYIDVMREIVEARLRTWPAQGQIDLMEEIKHLTFHIVVRLLFGAGEEELPVLYHHFEELGLGLFTPFRFNLPGFRFHRGLRARRWLSAYLDGQIQRFRQGGAPLSLLGDLLRGEAERGEGLSDESLRSEMLAFLFAGYDTTASMLTSFFASLGERPDVLRQLAADARARSDADDTAAALFRQELLDAALTETERLHPPLTFALRGVLRGFSFQGFEIPAGSKVAYSPYYTGRMAEVFEQPGSFLPERFLEERRPPPYTVLGFGGGHRACIGKRFAGLEMRLIITLILRRFDLSIVPGQSNEVFFNPTMQRRHGLRCEVTRVHAHAHE
jgi:cytochrome P450